MEQGGVEKDIVAMALKRGHGTYDGFLLNLPDKIKGAPVLLPGLELFYDAFMDLASSRGHTAGGPGSIPFSEVSAWASHYDLDHETFELLWLFIRRMDAVYLDYVRSKSKG